MEKKSGMKITGLSKRKLPWLLVLFLIGMVLLTVSNFIPSSGENDGDTSAVSSLGQEKISQEEAPAAETATLAESEADIEERLETILSSVQGVGKVSVTVTLENGPQYIYATNENINESKVEEKDSNGSQRVTTETTNSDEMVLSQPVSMGGQQPVVVKEIKPEIAGVLVAAEGARDAEIKATLAMAVQTLLDIPAHKVSVLPKNLE